MQRGPDGEIGERVKAVRKALALTQQEFADALGVKRATIGNYDLGRNDPSEAVIQLVLRVFNVNERWLRTGEGEMFNTPDERIARFVDEVQSAQDGDIRKRTLSVLAQLGPAEWELLGQIAHAIDAGGAGGQGGGADGDRR